jgi:UDPglucose 6-dehydrogenase
MTTRPRLTVIGTGYLGATHAVCMAELGFEVLGLDVLPEKVEALASGGCRSSSRGCRSC